MPFPSLVLNDGYKARRALMGFRRTYITGTLKLDPSTCIWSVIHLGSGSVNKGHDISDTIELAIETGIHHLDTAQFYSNEESIGKAIRESGLPRSEFFITTKYTIGKSPVEELEESLKKIGVAYVDLYLIHWPAALKDIPATWRGMIEAQERGLTRSIGVSNFTVAYLEQIKDSKVTPAVNQISLNPYNIVESAPIIAASQRRGIVIEAYSSLVPITKQPGGPVDKVLARIGKRLNATPTQVIFLWVAAKGAVIVTTTSKKERMLEYVAAGDLGSLTQQEIEEIDRAGAARWKTGLLFRGLLLTVGVLLYGTARFIRGA